MKEFLRKMFPNSSYHQNSGFIKSVGYAPFLGQTPHIIRTRVVRIKTKTIYDLSQTPHIIRTSKFVAKMLTKAGVVKLLISSEP